jgi:hypothetical protein
MLFWKQNKQTIYPEFIINLGAERYGHLGVEWPTRCVYEFSLFSP